jgi:hypothetical protein
MASNSGKATIDRAEAASYLASMLEDLSPLAQRNGLHVLAYLIDMAVMEAKVAAGHAAHSRDLSR